MARECPQKTGTRTQVQLTWRSGMSRILRLSLRHFCSSLVSPEPSSTGWPAMGNTLWAMVSGKTDAGGKITLRPSKVSAAALSTVLRSCSSSSATPARPSPETDW